MQDTADNTVLDDLLAVDAIRGWTADLWVWVEAHVLNAEVAIQLTLIVAAVVPAALFGRSLAGFMDRRFNNPTNVDVLNRLVEAIEILAIPIVLYLSLLLTKIVLGIADRPTVWVSGALALMIAWIVVRMVTLVIRSRFWSKVAFYVAWPVAALDAFGALAPVVEQMQALTIPIGTDDSGERIDISLFDVLRTLLYFLVLFWGANLLSRILQAQIDQIEELSPSFKALLGKVLSVLLPTIAMLIAFQIVGFNITALAVFSGALGLGVGLGLQNIVANFLAGFTLIADKSIKPGDTIEIDGTMGWVISLQARYVALRTRDGTELLIPNDRFMGEGVINWSRTDQVVRQHAPFGVSYKTRDLKAVQALAVEAALSLPRVVADPEPSCNLMEFGDSSVNFDLRYWISDPQNGLSNVRSEVLLVIWERLHEQGIEIPFPQRDLHVRSWGVPAAPMAPGEGA